MERVQFQQEQMLNELKDLVEKSLFTEVCVVNLQRRMTERIVCRKKSKKS